MGKEKYEELIVKNSNNYHLNINKIENENCENCIGSYLKDSKEVYHSNEIQNGENLKYCFKLNNAKNCYDYDVW